MTFPDITELFEEQDSSDIETYRVFRNYMILSVIAFALGILSIILSISSHQHAP